MTRLKSPSISVVVPVRNGARHIGRQLDALSRQTCEWPWELIVADNGSTDNTRAICERPSNFKVKPRVIDASGSAGANYARNRGVQESNGSCLLFCDSDDEVERDWLAGMQSAFAAGHDVIAGGIRLIYPRGEAALLPGSTDKYDFLPWGGSANLGVARELFERVGGFDETYRGGAEEIEFLWRAQIITGAEVVSVPHALISKYSRATALETFKQQRRYQQAAYRLWQEFAPYGMPRPHVLDDVFTQRRSDTGDRLVSWPVQLAKSAGRLVGNVQGELAVGRGQTASDAGGAGLC